MNEQAAAIAIESVRVRIARQMRETHGASQRSAKYFLYGTRDVRSRTQSECALNGSGASVQIFIDARSAQNTNAQAAAVAIKGKKLRIARWMREAYGARS